MTHPHPATTERASLTVFVWRFFSGDHLDGKRRTNATWLKRGTVPPHHVNWWTGKPRFHRMLWRWGMVLVPVGWIIAYQVSPKIDLNMTVIVTLCALPYIIHHGLLTLLNHLPSHTVVYVHDNVKVEDVDTDLDNVAIPELMGGDMQRILDGTITTGDDINTDGINTKPDRRRS